MSDTTILVRRHPDCAPGTWWWTRGQAGPTVSCPGCQALHLLDLQDKDEGHAVAADGTVSPSVVCTACGWHKDIRLEGWTGGPC